MQQRSLKDFLKASENGGYLLLYSPTTCSTIGVAELGVWCGMVWCARRRGRRRCSPSAVPWAAYKRHSRSQSFHTRPRQSFLSVCRIVLKYAPSYHSIFPFARATRYRAYMHTHV